MAELRRRLLNLLISLDQFALCLITLGHSNPDWTISASAWRWEQQRKPAGKLRPLIDWLFSPLEDEHCYKSYLNEISR
jgi:hypothetical protein